MEPQDPKPPLARADYIRQLLAAYRGTPGTSGRIHGPDRILAEQLYQRGISLQMVENALLLAAARRLFRPPHALPLPTIRSLAYFLPVLEELQELQVSQTYFEHIRRRIASLSNP